MVTDFDKVLAGQARNPERFYIVSGFHHGELVVGAIDKPGETVARLYGHVVVVDDDMMVHAQLGNDNLLIYAGTIGGVLEVDADHLVLVSSKQLLNIVDVVVHHGRVTFLLMIFLQKFFLTLVHRIVSSRDLLLPSMIFLLKCCRDRCLLTLRPAS